MSLIWLILPTYAIGGARSRSALQWTKRERSYREHSSLQGGASGRGFSEGLFVLWVPSRGLAAGPSLQKRIRLVRHFGWTLHWHGVLAKSSVKHIRLSGARTSGPNSNYDMMPCWFRTTQDPCHRRNHSLTLWERTVDTPRRHWRTHRHVTHRSRIWRLVSCRSTFRRFLSLHPSGLLHRPTGVCGSWRLGLLGCRSLTSSHPAQLCRACASTDPLPMDRLALFDNNTVRDWPAEDRHQLLAVTLRDTHSTQECRRPHTISGRTGSSARYVCGCRRWQRSSYDHGDLPEIDRRRPSYTGQHSVVNSVVNCDCSLRPGSYMLYMSGHFC